MRQKIKLEESLTNFGQQRKNWVEPLRSFILSLKEATDLEKTSSHLEWKKFFQKIGSNPEIKDKMVSIRWGDLWDFAMSAKGGRISDCSRIAKRNAFDPTIFADVTCCALILHFARTFFERQSD
jgi:hypothetical protein